MNATALHQTASGKWVKCNANLRACPRKNHVSVYGDAKDATEFFELLDPEAETDLQLPAMQLTAATVKVLGALEKAGLDPYIVGGSVRDAVLGGVIPKDVDIEVYGGEVSEVAKALRALGRVDEVGKSFGVLKLMVDGEDFDISLPRKDSKTGEGHRDFEVQVDPNLSLEEASSRRDYTINALMYSHSQGRIIDLHSGLQDLKDGYLRHVSDAFDEDPLRVLRGVQMAARFSMRLHPETIEKAATLREKYSTLAVERVQIEFQKLYEKGQDFPRGMEALRATGWDRLFPGLAEADAARLDAHLRRASAMIETKEIPSKKRALILSAIMASEIEASQRAEFLKYTTVDGDTHAGALALASIAAPEPSSLNLRAWAHDLPRQISVRDWYLTHQALGDGDAREIYEKADALGVLDKAEADLMTGFDLMNLFPNRPAGPWRRDSLNRVREAQYAEKFRTHEEGLLWMSQHAGELG